MAQEPAASTRSERPLTRHYPPPISWSRSSQGLAVSALPNGSRILPRVGGCPTCLLPFWCLRHFNAPLESTRIRQQQPSLGFAYCFPLLSQGTDNTVEYK